MSKKIYHIIVNLLLFYFIVAVVNGVTVINDSLAVRIVVGLVFGVLMAYTAQVLVFLKISVNAWASLLISIVLSFVFFFVISNVVQVVAFGATNADLGIGNIVLQLDTGLTTLIFVSLISAAFSVGLKQLGKASQ